jgi:hypothetical protein
LDLNGEYILKKKYQLNDKSQTSQEIIFKIIVRLIYPEPRVWLEPSLKKNFVEELDIEYGQELIVIFPGAK